MTLLLNPIFEHSFESVKTRPRLNKFTAGFYKSRPGGLVNMRSSSLEELNQQRRQETQTSEIKTLGLGTMTVSQQSPGPLEQKIEVNFRSK